MQIFKLALLAASCAAVHLRALDDEGDKDLDLPAGSDDLGDLPADSDDLGDADPPSDDSDADPPKEEEESDEEPSIEG